MNNALVEGQYAPESRTARTIGYARRMNSGIP